MRAKEYLLQLYKLEKLIPAKLEMIEQLKESAVSTSLQTSEKVQSSPKGDGLENKIIKYVDMEAELQSDVLKAHRKRNEILATLELLPPVEYSVLYDKYVEYLPFYVIADKMEKSYSYVTKKHGRGLKKLQEILNERDERN